jgi:hypothetical protein
MQETYFLCHVNTGKLQMLETRNTGLHMFTRNHKGKRRYSYPCNTPWRSIGLWDVEVPIFSLESRLRDGGKFVSLMQRPHITPQEESWHSFRLEAESHSAAGRIRQIKKIYFIGNRTRDLLACNIVPQPTTLPSYLSELNTDNRLSNATVEALLSLLD